MTSGFNSCAAIPAEQIECLTGFEKSNNQNSCDSCNTAAGFFASDAVFRLAAGTQRQICTKPSSKKTIIIIVVVSVVVLIILIVVVVIFKRKKSGAEADLKSSMISKN